MRSSWWVCSLVFFGCPSAEHRERATDFGQAKMFVLAKAGDGSDFGGGSYGGLGFELVSNGDWLGRTAEWKRIAGGEVYKLALDTRGLNLFVHAGRAETWDDTLRLDAWSEVFNINDHALAFHRDVYAFDRHFRFAAPTQTPAGANPPVDTPLKNEITAKGSLKAWVAYTHAGDGANLSVLDGVNIAGVTPENDGRTARVSLAAKIDGTVAVEAHYNHQGLANPYRLIVTREVSGSHVEVEHYDVAHQTLRDQRLADHGATYVFVYGRQD